MSITILGIETSCDDTSASVIRDGIMLSNIIASQKVHEEYGGVVPELASRAHQKNIIPVVDLAMKRANINKNELSAIAFTRGPGLLGSLLVGTSFAKAFALGLNIPLVDVNHMQGHILAHFVKEPDEDKVLPNFPFLCLTVSGGHTQISIIKSHFDMEIIGQTIDDAAGEAFDKAAKTLGLPYPGGPFVDKNAKLGDPLKFKFSEPKIPNLNFSFSGIKTSILYFLRDQLKNDPQFIEKNMNDLCASIQHSIINILMNKLKTAVQQTGITEIAIAGGVSANSGLRDAMIKGQDELGWKVHIPKFQFTTDNAAMIAITGYFKYLEGNFSSFSAIPFSKV